jgi:peptidoglycan hydrolase-like protein with peptidoglycan-binding domain
MNTPAQNGQPTQPITSLPDLKLPISSDPRHPVNSEGANVYYSRTDNLVGLTPDKQAIALAEAMRGVGPGKVFILEANGPRNGSYTNELSVALPAALALIPENQRPEIRLFISDGRPAIADPTKANDPTAARNDFTTFLQGLEREKPGSGIVHTDNSQGTARVIPNWNNPAVVDYFMRERVQPTIDLAKQLGIQHVVVDDHIGVPTANMADFRRVNGMTHAQATNAITGAYEQVLGAINNAGLKPGLSTAGDSVKNLEFGIDTQRLAPLTNRVEIQGYRQTPELLQTMVDNLYDDVSKNFGQYRGVKEFNIALVTRANKEDLSPETLAAQQKIINQFEQKIVGLYRDKGVPENELPKVNTSLWAHQHFYQDPLALRQGQQGPRVKELQEALNAAGILVDGQPLPTTGNYGEMTKKAVAEYQKQNGLAISGEADKNTLLALGIHPKQQEQPTQQTTPSQVTPSQTTPSPTPTTPTPLQPTSSATPDNTGRDLITHRDHLGGRWIEQANAALLRTPEGPQMNDETRTKVAALMTLEAMSSGRIAKIESAEVLPGGQVISSDRATTREIDARLTSTNINGLENMSLRDISQKIAELPEASRNRAPEPLSDPNPIARNQQNQQESLNNPTLAQDSRQTQRTM